MKTLHSISFCQANRLFFILVLYVHVWHQNVRVGRTKVDGFVSMIWNFFFYVFIFKWYFFLEVNKLAYTFKGLPVSIYWICKAACHYYCFVLFSIVIAYLLLKLLLKREIDFSSLWKHLFSWWFLLMVFFIGWNSSWVEEGSLIFLFSFLDIFIYMSLLYLM